MRQTYSYRMPWGETLRISADLAQASAPIYLPSEEEGEDGMQLPYQTADARHLESEMLRLVVDYLGADFYASPDSEDDHETQMERAIAGAVEITPAPSFVESFPEDSDHGRRD